MSQDISKILDDWQYEAGEVVVRLVEGDDGREKIQLRVDLGLLQMEIDGRPDGTRPEGFSSWLDFYLRRQQDEESESPDGPPFELSEEDCMRLWREAVQYYHRALSFWHLKMYDRCARDTDRNLRLFAFVRSYAPDDRIKGQFEQWRCYVLLMRTRAVATSLIERGEHGQALEAIEAGIEAIREFLDEYNLTDQAEQSAELSNLEQWREQVLLAAHQAGQAEPGGTIEILRRRLQEAVAEERFEDAAELRDQIRRLAE